MRSVFQPPSSFSSASEVPFWICRDSHTGNRQGKSLVPCQGADDQLDIFNERIKIYLESLAEIEAFYVSKGLLERIDGEQGVSDVVAAMLSIIKRSH